MTDGRGTTGVPTRGGGAMKAYFIVKKVALILVGTGVVGRQTGRQTGGCGVGCQGVVLQRSS